MAEKRYSWRTRKRSPVFHSNDVLSSNDCTYNRSTGGLFHLDYLAPLEHGRPSTALRFPGRWQIAAYRASTVILILPRTRPGNSWRARLRSYRKRRETTSGIAHTSTSSSLRRGKSGAWCLPSPIRRVSPFLPIHLRSARVILFLSRAISRATITAGIVKGGERDNL